MSALVAHPAWQPDRQSRQPGTRPDHRPVRRGGLELVGPGFVPRTARPAAPVAASPTAQRPARGTTPAPLRLTRRGRAVLALLAFVVASALSVGLGVSLGLSAPAGAAGETVAVTVQPGDTLWVLAAGVAGPGEDVRDVVAEIAELNALRTHDLSAGQQVLVPVR